MHRYRIPVCLLLVSILTCPVGCSDRGSVIAPEGARSAGLFQVTERQPQNVAEGGTRLGQYRRVWPHEDGTGWAYHLTSRIWDQPPPVLFPTRDEVPVVSMDDAIRLLETEPTGANPETSTGSYRLQFNGLITTLSRVSRQNLQETLEQGATATATSATATSATATSATPPSATPKPGPAFMQLLRR